MGIILNSLNYIFTFLWRGATLIVVKLHRTHTTVSRFLTCNFTQMIGTRKSIGSAPCYPSWTSVLYLDDILVCGLVINRQRCHARCTLFTHIIYGLGLTQTIRQFFRGLDCKFDMPKAFTHQSIHHMLTHWLTTLPNLLILVFLCIRCEPLKSP